MLVGEALLLGPVITGNDDDLSSSCRSGECTAVGVPGYLCTCFVGGFGPGDHSVDFLDELGNGLGERVDIDYAVGTGNGKVVSGWVKGHMLVAVCLIAENEELSGVGDLDDFDDVVIGGYGNPGAIGGKGYVAAGKIRPYDELGKGVCGSGEKADAAVFRAGDDLVILSVSAEHGR